MQKSEAFVFRKKYYICVAGAVRVDYSRKGRCKEALHKDGWGSKETKSSFACNCLPFFVGVFWDMVIWPNLLSCVGHLHLTSPSQPYALPQSQLSIVL